MADLHWHMLMDLFRICSLMVFLPDAAYSQDGEDCEVVKQEGNKTYRDIIWCDYGCCQYDDRADPCCEPTATQGIVYGVVIVTVLVVAIACVYIRIKRAVRAVKRNNSNQPAADVRETAPAHGTVDSPEQDPPPPYWMCVGEPPSQNTTSAPLSTSTPTDGSEPGQDCLSSNVQRPDGNIVSEENDQHPASSTAVSVDHVNEVGPVSPVLPSIRSSPSNGFSDLRQGVVLHPLSLGAPPPSPCGRESESLTELSEFGGGGKEETVVMVLPGHLSADVRQSLLQSSHNSRVLFCKTVRGDENGSSPHGSTVHSCRLADSLSPRRDIPESASSIAPPSYEASSSGAGERSVLKESCLADILKRLSPGSILVIENNGNVTPGN